MGSPSRRTAPFLRSGDIPEVPSPALSIKSAKGETCCRDVRLQLFFLFHLQILFIKPDDDGDCFYPTARRRSPPPSAPNESSKLSSPSPAPGASPDLLSLLHRLGTDPWRRNRGAPHCDVRCAPGAPHGDTQPWERPLHLSDTF